MPYETKKQLRERLEVAEDRAKVYQDIAAKAEEKVDTFHERLEADGWKPVYSGGITFTNMITGKTAGTIVGWTAPDREAERKAAEEKTRRETLEKVIDALELKDYGYREPNAYRFDIYTRAQHADRLWADLNTALEHREAEKHAETVRQTAEKVAGLAKKPDPARFFVFSHGESYGAAQTISESDIQVAPRKSGKSTKVDGAVSADKINKPKKGSK